MIQQSLNNTDLSNALHEDVYDDLCGTLYCNFGSKNTYHFHGMCRHDFQVSTFFTGKTSRFFIKLQYH